MAAKTKEQVVHCLIHKRVLKELKRAQNGVRNGKLACLSSAVQGPAKQTERVLGRATMVREFLKEAIPILEKKWMSSKPLKAYRWLYPKAKSRPTRTHRGGVAP